MPRTIRPIRVDGQLAYVTLTKGYVAVIDAADVPLVEGFNWCAKVGKNTIYAKRADYTKPKMLTVLMHRVIAETPDGMDTDHADGDGLNNRRANLRVATPSQNNKNQRIRADNTSGFKGVSWFKPHGRWRAQIGVNGKLRPLGYFITAESAADAYAKASSELHGVFGRTR